MIALPPGVRVYLACGATDMRKGLAGPAMVVQQGLGEAPFDGALYAFRGRRAGLIKLLWHDGVGLCLLTKRLEYGQFVWPSTSTTGSVRFGASVTNIETSLRVSRSGPQIPAAARLNVSTELLVPACFARALTEPPQHARLRRPQDHMSNAIDQLVTKAPY